MATRRDPRGFIFVILLIFLINSPDQQPQPFSTRARFEQTIAQEWDALHVLNTTLYGDFDSPRDKWLNLTGLREEDGFPWDLLAPVQQRAKDQVRNLLGEAADSVLNGPLEKSPSMNVYQNVSGSVHGEWVRSNLGTARHPSDMNMTALFPDNPFPLAEFDRNLTAKNGGIRIHLSEIEGRAKTNTNRTISQVSARVVIGEDTTLGEWWEMQLHGVHYPEFGGIVLTTTSEKFAGIFALPHFALSEYLYSLSQELLNRTVAETIERQNNRMLYTWNPWTSAADGSNEAFGLIPRCEYIFFLQQHAVEVPFNKKGYSTNGFSSLQWLEHELRYPTGAPPLSRSPLSMSMVGFSPDCGFVIESKGPPDFARSESHHLVGSKAEEYHDKARKQIIVFAGTLALQLLLLVRQMKETATPSTRNRVSFYTIVMLALGDGFAGLSLIFLHLLLGSAQLVLYAAAALALFSVAFELRFLIDIWTVQATERRRQERERPSTTSPPSEPGTGTSETQPPNPPGTGDTLPLPVTASRPLNLATAITAAGPIIIPSSQDSDDDIPTTTTEQSPRADLGTLCIRFCLLLLVLFFLFLYMLSLSTLLWSVFFRTLSLAYLSFWLPQISRNVMRNCRQALRWDFVLVQSVGRLVPVVYFMGAEGKSVRGKGDWSGVWVVVGWVWVQIVMLKCQEVLGSRFFVKERWGWVPAAYDYHPILREDEEGANFPSGPIQSFSSDDSGSSRKAGESKVSKGKKVFDCSICAQDIEVPVVSAGESAKEMGLGGIMLQRRAYMVTPCCHIFHTPCLEGWMRYRLVCPNCRETLPPL